MMRRHAVSAIARREVTGWFSNPAGYVFLTLFVFLCAVAAFWQDRFFAENLATLAPLDDVFPLLLLFFVPAVTMGTWAEERRQGTEELLLTMPATDGEIVLGKYLGALGIYLAALVFSAANVAVLAYLGDPDKGLLLGSFLGYAFLGGSLVAVGMVGSLLASNVTVAFILGALLCAATVFADRLGVVLGGRAAELAEQFGVRTLFRGFTEGTVPLPGVVVFAGIAIAALQANVALVRLRRHGRGPLFHHDLARTACLVVALVSAGVLAHRVPFRPDLTEEALHSLSPETRELLGEITADRPVFVQAFVSPKVPREHVQTRDDLLSLLREFDRIGGDRVLVRIQETENWTPEAREAEEKFGIKPQPVMTVRDGRGTSEEIFLGFVATCGLQEVVVPFLHPGIPVEYELTRSVRTAARPERLRVGVLRTDADLMGGFDFERMSQNPEWAIVTELKKQYEVVAVDPDADYPENLNVLVAAMASSLTSPQMDRLRDWATGGGAVLFFDDPLPLTDPALGPLEPKKKPGGNNPFGGGPPGEPKGDFVGLARELGIDWPVQTVIWDVWNPHPALTLEPEIVFVGEGGGNAAAFGDDPITSGLQEVVTLFPGELRPVQGSPVRFSALLRTGFKSGTVAAADCIQRTFFGPGGINPRRRQTPTPDDHILAARVQGDLPAKEGGGARKVNAVFVADLDLVSSGFFAMRAQGVEGLEFDNVTMVLNAVDVLAGDDSFVALRKRRRVHRTLTQVEKETRIHEERRMEDTRAAEDEAKRRLDDAQAALDQRVEELRARTDLDDNTRQIMVAAAQEAESRRLEVATAGINDERDAAIRASRAEAETSVRAIQHRIRRAAVILPPLPALLLGLWVFRRRLARERSATPERRRVEDPS